MKRLIERLFKREVELNYVIAEYKPSYEQMLKGRSKMADYGDELLTDKDEMEIDNLYQRN